MRKFNLGLISGSIYIFEGEKRCTPIAKCSIQLILADNRKRNQMLFKSFSFFHIFVENIRYKWYLFAVLSLIKKDCAVFIFLATLNMIKNICFCSYISTFLLLFPLGSNVFIHPYYNTDIFVIDDSSFEKWYGISIEINTYWPTEFELSTTISIKELLLYNFRKEEPITKIPNSIFSLVNYTSSETRKNYYLKVSRKKIAH